MPSNAYTRTVTSLLPPIKIHSWGGLGSQLHAVQTLYDLRKKYPRRRSVLVLHTGGVTRRFPEITALYPELEYSYVDDFARKGTSPHIPQTRHTFNLKRAGRLLFRWLGFVSDLNSSEELHHCKPWLLQARGHYSSREVDPSFMMDLSVRVEKTVNKVELDLSSTCAIHYRLGDLLTLVEKNPISPNFIAAETKRIADIFQLQNTVLFSDSQVDASELLSKCGVANIRTPVADTLQVIYHSAKARYFVGTSSKISFWIAGLRISNGAMHSSLPQENIDQFNNYLSDAPEFITGYPVA